MTVAEFIRKSKNVHGLKYDYSNVEYVNSCTNVCIVCPKHGEFLQTPNSHFSGKGCPKCQESQLEKDVRMLLEENILNMNHQSIFHG